MSDRNEKRALIDDIDRDDERHHLEDNERAKIKGIIEEYRRMGYSVTRLEKHIDGDFQNLMVEADRYTKSARALWEIGQMLRGMDTRGLESERAELESKLRDPYQLNEARALYEKLQERIKANAEERVRASERQREHELARMREQAAIEESRKKALEEARLRQEAEARRLQQEAEQRSREYAYELEQRRLEAIARDREYRAACEQSYLAHLEEARKRQKEYEEYWAAQRQAEEARKREEARRASERAEEERRRAEEARKRAQQEERLRAQVAKRQAAMDAKVTAKLNAVFAKLRDYPPEYNPLGKFLIGEEWVSEFDPRTREVSGRVESGLLNKCSLEIKCAHHRTADFIAREYVTRDAKQAESKDKFVAICYIFNELDTRTIDFFERFRAQNACAYAFEMSTGRLVYNKNDWKTELFSPYFAEGARPKNMRDLLDELSDKHGIFSADDLKGHLKLSDREIQKLVKHYERMGEFGAISRGHYSFF